MANWLEFDKIFLWEYPAFIGFAYDHIPNEKIDAALNHPLLNHIDPALDWEADDFLVNEKGISDEDKHAFRVASLVKAFRGGQPMQKSIEIDTFSVGQCAYCICNGHHRIRALQYLGLEAGPFSLSGSLSVLEDLVSLAGCYPTASAAQFVAPELLIRAEDDVIPFTVVENPFLPSYG